jgi:hypothetical protein
VALEEFVVFWITVARSRTLPPVRSGAVDRDTELEAEAVSTYLLRGPIHGAIVPVFHYSQFFRFEMVVRDQQAVKKAQKRWHELADERDHQWTRGLWEELLTGAGSAA